MSAYDRGNLSVEGYLLRILAALCRQSGGELRVSGEEVDRVGEPTALTKEWDSKTQQLVLRVESVSFREVFKLTPEKQTPRVVERSADPMASIFRDRDAPLPVRPTAPVEEFLPKGTTLDDEHNSMLERERRLKRAAAIFRAEAAMRKRDKERQETV
jgi:hypothetical protein